jgi:hypothetical protein
MACKDDCGEGDYEKAKEQTGCRSSSLTIAAPVVVGVVAIASSLSLSLSQINEPKGIVCSN